MGYYSDFEISVVAGHDPLEDAGFQAYFKYATSLEFESEMYEVKWYEMVKNMTDISLKYPDTVFRVYVDGEDPDDESINYFWNGQYIHRERDEIPEPLLSDLPGLTEAKPEFFI